MKADEVLVIKSEDVGMKWLIASLPNRGSCSFDAQKYWEERHGELDYENVYSATEDPTLRARIADILRDELGHAPATVLVPGCGARGTLECDLARTFPAMTILATDYQSVIEAASLRVAHPRVSFAPRDTRTLGFSSDFDASIVVNSILSDDDTENRQMLAAVRESLRANGLFIGLFPTVFATADIGYCDPAEGWRLELVDLQSSRYLFDEIAGYSQILYTPLRLRAILREVGFSKIRMEIFFCDSPALRNEADRIYGLQGEDLVLYELLVTAHSKEIESS